VDQRIHAALCLIANSTNVGWAGKGGKPGFAYPVAMKLR